MIKKIIGFTFFLSIVGGLLYLNYISVPNIEFNLGENVIETSTYGFAALILIIVRILFFISGFFKCIKNIFYSIISFFTGSCEKKAQKALMDSFAYALAGKHKTAQKTLKIADKYFKDNKYKAYLKLILDKQSDAPRPSIEALATLESHKDFAPLTAFVHRLYHDKKQDNYHLQLTEQTGLHKETINGLAQYLFILLQHKSFDKAMKIIKYSVLLDKDQKNQYYTYIYIIQAADHFEQKKIEAALKIANKALSYDPQSKIALYIAFKSYISLLKENKAERLLESNFKKMPHYTALMLFLTHKDNEDIDIFKKRLKALGEPSEKSDIYTALTYYHLFKSDNIHRLSSSIASMPPEKSDEIWVQSIQLCAITANDLLLKKQAEAFFMDAIKALSYDEILSEINIFPKDFSPLLTSILRLNQTKSGAEINASLTLFKSLLKHIPIKHDINSNQHNFIDNEDVKKLYHGNFQEDHGENG